MSRTAIAVVAAVLSGTASAAITAPAVGTSLRYECDGPYASQVTSRVVSVDGNTVRSEGHADQRTTWSEKPLWALPTTYAPKRSRGDDRGERTMRIKKGKPQGLAALTPGTEFKATIREEHDKGSSNWHYTFTVGQPARVSHPVAGDVEAVQVTESRSTGSYSATLQAQFVPSLGYSIGWTYDDRRGTQACRLAATG